MYHYEFSLLRHNHNVGRGTAGGPGGDPTPEGVLGAIGLFSQGVYAFFRLIVGIPKLCITSYVRVHVAQRLAKPQNPTM